MKFRLVDRILAVSESHIETRKGVSFEEFSLLKPWGRKGALPESLLLQMAVESASLLEAHASGFTRIGVLEEVVAARFESNTRPGEVLRAVVRREEAGFAFTIQGTQTDLVAGKLTLRSVPLDQGYDPEAFVLMWKAMYGAP